MAKTSRFKGYTILTKAQFDDLIVKDPDKQYLITDDEAAGNSSHGTLYRHVIDIMWPIDEVQNHCLVTIISSDDVPVDSSEILKNYLGNTFKYPAGGSVQLSDNSQVLPAVWITESGAYAFYGGSEYDFKFRSFDGATFVDAVTTI